MALSGLLNTPANMANILPRASLLILTILAVSCGVGCAFQPHAGGVAVWIVDETREITPDSEPLFENEIFSATQRETRLAAAVNDTVAFQLVLHSGEQTPAGPFDLRFSDLTGAGGVLRAADVITAYRAHGVRIQDFHSWYPAVSGRAAVPAVFFDMLVPWNAPRGGGPLPLDQGQTGMAWIDVRVPIGVAPGEYVGRLDVLPSGSSRPIFTTTLVLHVAPVAIPSEPTTTVFCRVDPSDLLAEHLNWPRSPVEELCIDDSTPDQRAAKRLIDSTMRLFHEHRTAPLLWAAFPKYRLRPDRTVEIDWTAYDALVEDWLSGDAFDDQVGLSRWLMPAAADYPNADRNGGFQSAQYAGLLSAYIAECRRHFDERGWLDGACLRLTPPGELTQAAVDRLRRTIAIVRMSDSSAPIVAHLPASSLRSLGWHNAVDAETPDVDVWAPEAMWFEPEAMSREQGLGKQAWFRPGAPPYSVSLAPEAPAADARLLAWQAQRYQADAVWIEDAAALKGQAARREGLVYAGAPFGLADRPIPSIRLKRIRRGLLDAELLHLLELQGKPLLANRTVEQLVRRAFTDACEENLLSTRPAGWTSDPQAMWLAQRVLLQELENEFAPTSAGRGRQVDNLADWGALMNRSVRLAARILGVRLKTPDRLAIFAAADNPTRRAIEGRWRFLKPPPGWNAPDAISDAAPAGGSAAETIEVKLESLMYNAAGIYPFQLEFATAQGDELADGRLAVCVCPMTTTPPHIDGDLSDWMLASNNVAADFRLVRGDGQYGERRPTLNTQAFFCMDFDRIYVAVRCAQPADERPLWRADNRVPLDGAVPWGQDLIEILLEPRNVQRGGAENVFVFQIKPSGLLVARRGALTDPPMNDSTLIQSGAVTAVRHEAGMWIVEASIPLDALGEAARRNRVWGCNVTRLDARRGEYSSWSGAREYAYLPRTLGNLVLLRP